VDRTGILMIIKIDKIYINIMVNLKNPNTAPFCPPHYNFFRKTFTPNFAIEIGFYEKME